MKPRHTKTMVGTALLLVLLAGVAAALYAAVDRYQRMNSQLEQLSAEVRQVRQEQTMPGRALERYRNSICFIYAVYELPIKGKRPVVLRNSGTGFLVAEGTVASNRHVLVPAFDDSEAKQSIAAGARPRLKKLVAFFPSMREAVQLTDVRTSPSADLAVARLQWPNTASPDHPLPLAHDLGKPGDAVVVIGYPLGVAGMVAKSSGAVYDRLAYRGEDVRTASELASLSLVRPSATYGRLGDVVGSKLIYDAPTAHGASGGPVLNAKGEVIAINSAFITGFAGGTLGVSVSELRTLLP